MNIDWNKAPEGATHYNCGNQYFYRFHPKAEVWFGGCVNGWTDAAAPTPEHYQGDTWVIRPKDYSNLKELAEAATPGPWFSLSIPDTAPERVYDTDRNLICRPARPEDARFVSAANPSEILTIIAELEELRGRQS